MPDRLHANARSFALLPLLLMALTSSGFSNGGPLYTVTAADAQLRTVDPVSGHTLTSIAITDPNGGTILGARGLATQPSTGDLWALLILAGQIPTELARIDAATGIATRIGHTGIQFDGLDFDQHDVIHGVSATFSAVPSRFCILSQITGRPTDLFGVTNPGSGKALCFDRTQNVYYHAAGFGTPNATSSGEQLETVDVATSTLNLVPLSGADYAGTSAVLHWVSELFLFVDSTGAAFTITANGLVNPLSTLDHVPSGLAYRPVANGLPFFDHYGDTCPSLGGHRSLITASGDPVPGQTFALHVRNLPGGAFGLLMFGTGNQQLPLAGGCALQMLPAVPNALIAFTAVGPVNGGGAFDVGATIPPGTRGDMTVQAGAIIGLGLTVTNGVFVHFP